jgi:hypothetical protein
VWELNVTVAETSSQDANFRPDDVYFSAADGRITTSALKEGFSKALIHASLVDSRLVIPDIFFFNSPGLRDHVLNADGISLLEVAIEQGLIVPALRNRATSFLDIASQMESDRIVGLISPQDFRAVGQRLDEARRRGHVSWAEWPPLLGESYNKLLTKILQVEQPPSFGGDRVDSDLWRLTKNLRFDAIEKAREYRRSQGGTDIRRGEIITEVGRILGVLGKDEQVSDLDVVLRELRKRPGGEEGSWYRAADAFYEWLDELYRFNQADRMNVQPSATNSRPGTIGLLAQAYRLTDYGPSSGPPPVAAKIEAEVEVPRFETLGRLDAHALLDLRQYGRVWRANANEFLAAPTVHSRHNAEESLEQYAHKLRRAARTKVLQTMQIEGAAGLVLTTGSEAADLVMQSLGNNFSIASMVAVVTGGYLSTQYIVKLHGQDKIEKRLDRGRDPKNVSSLELPDPNPLGAPPIG